MENKFEIICPLCSQTFFSNDEEDMYCPACWAKLMSDFFKTIRYDRFDI